MSDEKKRTLPTLSEYIESNHKLISTLAIFAALAAFSNNIPDKDLGALLSCLFLALAIIIFIELYANFPPDVYLSKKGRLYWFGELLFVTMFLFVMFWAVTYVRFWLPFVVMPMLFIPLLASVFVLTKVGLGKVLARTSWFKSRTQRVREEIVPTFGAMVVMIVVYWGFAQRKLIIEFWSGVFGGRP